VQRAGGGGVVHWARDAEEANRIVGDLVLALLIAGLRLAYPRQGEANHAWMVMHRFL